MSWTPEAYVADQFERSRRAWVKLQIPLLAEEYADDQDGLVAAMACLDERFHAQLRDNIEAQEVERRRRYRAALDALRGEAPSATTAHA